MKETFNLLFSQPQTSPSAQKERKGTGKIIGPQVDGKTEGFYFKANSLSHAYIAIHPLMNFVG